MTPPSGAGPGASPSELLQTGIGHHQAGRLVEAERVYRRILQTAPGHPDALHLLGLIAHQAGQTDAALHLIGDAIARNPGASGYHANLAMILETAGRAEDAASAARRALELAPAHAGAMATLANSLRAMDRHGEAISWYEQAARAAPGDPAVWSNLGSTLDILGRHDEAVEAFTRAVALAPGQAGLQSNLGSALKSAGRLAESIAAHRESIRVDPGFAAGHTNLATALLEAGTPDEVPQVLERVLALRPGDRKALALSAIAAGARGDVAQRDRLLDFEGLMADRQWDAPAGYTSMEAFNDALAHEVLAHTTLTWEPASKSTRRGSQTRELSGTAGGAVATLESMVSEALATYLANVPPDADHPYLSTAPDDWTLTLWATVLEEGGHQAPHIHPTGWLSGVYYVQVPAAAPGSEPEAGWIEFGRPPAVMEPLGGFPLRLFEPTEGRMLLFPSYFYHRTLPFSGAGQRISIAFDLMPASEPAAVAAGVAAATLTGQEAASELARAEQLLRDGDLESAEQVLARLPGDLEPAGRVHQLRGLAAHRRGRLDDAADHMRRAAQLATHNPQFQRDLGVLLHKAGRLEEAAEAFESAAGLEGDGIASLLQLANVYSDLGNETAARDAYSRALAKNPASGTAHYGLALLKRFEPDDPQIAQIRHALTDAGDTNDTASLWYALGRALDQTGQTDAAFAAFEQANRIKRTLTDFSIEAERSNTRRIIDSFPAPLFGRPELPGFRSDLPVFVVGMPRSGTTLVEQILDSHPQVHGAGELNDLWRTVAGVTRSLPPGQSLPEAVSLVPDAAWRSLGEQLVERMSGYAPQALRVVDKLPFNYTLLGVIRLMLPDARIVYCRRDPLDTCLSSYMTSFGNDRGFTCDLAELGETWRLHAELMDHWSRVLPGGVFTMVYEDLVTDLEGQSRRLVDALGLEWSDSCLDFHRNTRPVVTASMTQVRRPVYTSSIGRWRRFQDHLGPLITALGDRASQA